MKNKTLRTLANELSFSTQSDGNPVVFLGNHMMEKVRGGMGKIPNKDLGCLLSSSTTGYEDNQD